jgi:integrase
MLSLAVGIRTEEARELHWDHLDLDGDPSAARRTLALPQAAVQALREHRKRQAEDRLAAGPYGRTTAWCSLQP